MKNVKTLGDLVGTHNLAAREWDLTDGSHIFGPLSEAPETAPILTALWEVLPDQKVMVTSGIGADSTYEVHAPFLDGGFFASSQDSTPEDVLRDWEVEPGTAKAEELIAEYLAGLHTFAVIRGPKALLLIALGLGLDVPQAFYEHHGLEGMTSEGLLEDLRLDRAYRATTYAATVGDHTVRIRIDSLNPKADEALDLAEGETWAVLTAWNPASQQRPKEENDAAQERLRAALRQEGVRFFEGMSEPDDGHPGEASLLAVLPQERAAELGRAFGQNAIVVGGGRWRKAELVWL